jgi:hypothetical protein
MKFLTVQFSPSSALFLKYCSFLLNVDGDLFSTVFEYNSSETYNFSQKRGLSAIKRGKPLRI